MEPIPPQPGNLRDPRYFVGRRRTTEQARERLLAGASLSLSDPRRMGKTYWMHYFATTQDKVFNPFIIDYEGVYTIEDFLRRTAERLGSSRRLPSSARKAMTLLFDSIDSVSIAGMATVKSYHRQTSSLTLLERTLRTLDTGGRTTPLVMMDEVPLAVGNIATRQGADVAAELLQTLRALRQGTTRVRWVVAGSVGFHHVLRTAGATEGELNDLESLALGPLQQEEAEELATRLLLGVRATPEQGTVAELVSLTSGIPFLLHKVAALIDQQGLRSLDKEQVRECFEDFIDDPDEFGWFGHLLTRVDRYYGQDTDTAQRILDSALRHDSSWTTVDDLPQAPGTMKVIDALVSDHYLEARGRSVRWRYPALAYIWARRRRTWDRP